jgi:hypothetical protein
MDMGSGITGSVVGQLYSGNPTAFTPPPAAYPEGNQSVTAAAFGPQGGGQAPAIGHWATWIAAASLVVLVCFWWSAPR